VTFWSASDRAIISLHLQLLNVALHQRCKRQRGIHTKEDLPHDGQGGRIHSQCDARSRPHASSLRRWTSCSQHFSDWICHCDTSTKAQNSALQCHTGGTSSPFSCSTERPSTNGCTTKWCRNLTACHAWQAGVHQQPSCSKVTTRVFS